MNRNPLCACGCYRVEHEDFIDHDWSLVAGRCLTCDDCDGFTPRSDETEALEAGVAPA